MEEARRIKPDHINLLETLNVFGVRAQFMQQFKEYLEEEGLPPNDDRTVYVEFVAVYLELRHFLPSFLPIYFPSLEGSAVIDDLGLLCLHGCLPSAYQMSSNSIAHCAPMAACG